MAMHANAKQPQATTAVEGLARPYLCVGACIVQHSAQSLQPRHLQGQHMRAAALVA